MSPSRCSLWNDLQDRSLLVEIGVEVCGTVVPPFTTLSDAGEGVPCLDSLNGCVDASDLHRSPRSLEYCEGTDDYQSHRYHRIS